MSGETDETMDKAKLVNGRAASAAPALHKKSVDPDVDADADDQRQQRHRRQHRRLRRLHQRLLFDVLESQDVQASLWTGTRAELVLHVKWFESGCNSVECILIKVRA